MSEKKIKVLVIDDSAYNRRAITGMLEKAPDIEVIGTAADGEEGLKKALTLRPDIITVDLEMPVMDGFTFLRILMARAPIPVIVVSSRDDDANVFKALEFGAVDFLGKPTARISKDLLSIEKDIISKVRMVSELKMDNLKRRVGESTRPTRLPEPAPVTAPPAPPRARGAYDIVAIGASTGGPPALQAILTSLPADIPFAFVISQHMPPGFTKAFAERLNRLSSLEVKEAEEGDRLAPGRVLIAPGGHHMTFQRVAGEGVVKIWNRRAADMYSPSIDKMFTSIAELYEEKAIGIVLTGMGNDGSKGVVHIKNGNGFVIAESEETSIVYGMPREAVRTGMVDKILPLDRIPAEIVNLYGPK